MTTHLSYRKDLFTVQLVYGNNLKRKNPVKYSQDEKNVFPSKNAQKQNY